MDTLVTAKTRYATKAYNSEKKIPQTQFEKLLEVLRFSPSSVNIQPWHFLIAETDEAKQRIASALTGNYIYNAAKVLNSSHTLVFCTRTDISAEYLEQLLQQDDVSGRFKDETAKQGQRDTRQGYVEFYRNELKNLPAWMENQTYLALGQLLFAAGLEGIDATPMEGFDRELINKEFELTEKGLKASVIVSLGYRSENDFNAKLPKSRLSNEVVFTRL
ncbi:oxygen-insensitive NAD(P)H nitroreductase [Acinetobacter sp. TR11]|uniref:oxygen-insensitive NAD(P)H nitroreductase n=1 Tax=Acinetobacter sp. TR11 TaxID=3003393 RepID=UPI0022AC8119|nr:oxygen-insensitive NAD(P)H nitroreductase [Acinetobacter sp. TR11]WAU74619.1 oxygen-insensitive NAD(P)H nitroreductase [Acinetobacter sp. TR11]